MAYLYHRDWSRQEILQRVGHMDQVAGIKLVEAADGMERGSRMLQVWTGTGLYFHILADRALDISACRYKGVPLAWASSVGEIHPAYYEPEGLGWLRSFQGGLLVTCGLDHFGPPSSDAGEEFGLHGRLSNLPTQFVGYRTYWVEDDYKLEVTGEVRQTRVFGENLVLRRRISTRLGSNKIRIEDVVTNEGFAPQPHMILYHFNLGFPLVSENSRLHLEVQETVPRDKDAEPGLADWGSFQPPTAGYREQVFRHMPKADDDGKVRVEVENPSLGLGLRLTYDNTNLPYLVHWKMMGQGTYVLGIEPANCGVLQGRAAARKSGDLPQLAPGESCRYVIEVKVVEYPQP
ncbi:MAG: aldose 1-epimerase family protein [Anaerolineae bacterium]